MRFQMLHFVDTVDQENIWWEIRLFKMCYSQTLNRLHSVLMAVFIAFNHLILIINICQDYMCLGEKLLDVYVEFHIVLIMILLLS